MKKIYLSIIFILINFFLHSQECQRISIDNINSSAGNVVMLETVSCEGQEFTLSADISFPENNTTYEQSIENCTFLWEFPDGSSQNGEIAICNFENVGVYDIVLTVTDQIDCNKIRTIHVTVGNQALDVEIETNMPTSNDTIFACPGIPLEMQISPSYPFNNTCYSQSNFSTGFTWTYPDGTEANIQSIAPIYNSPGLRNFQWKATDIHGVSEEGNITVVVYFSPEFGISQLLEDTICYGDTIHIIGEVLMELPIPEAGVTFIPDGGSTNECYYSSISYDIFDPTAIMSDISYLESICLNIEHSYLGDLEIRITCPDGTEVIMKSYPGGAGTYLGEPLDGSPWDNNPIEDPDVNPPGVGWDYCFSPDANATMMDIVNAGGFGPSLPAGSYASENNLNALEGCPMNGDWTITIQDNLGIDNGYIFNWSMNWDTIPMAPVPVLFPHTDRTIISDQLTGNILPDDNIFDSLYTAMPSDSGLHTYRFLTRSNPMGCYYDTAFAVYVTPPLRFDVVDFDTLCIGENLDLSVEPQSGLAPFNYFWNGREMGEILSVSPITDKSFTIYISDDRGCMSDTQTVFVPVFPELEINLSSELVSLCPGDSILISASLSGGSNQGFSFKEDLLGEVGNSFYVSPAETKIYTIMGKDGCSTPEVFDSITIVVNPFPEVEILTNVLEGCSPLNIFFDEENNEENSIYFWDFGDGNYSTIRETNHFFNETGNYKTRLKVTSPFNCITEKDIKITVHEKPEAKFFTNPHIVSTINPRVYFEDVSKFGFYSYWNFDYENKEIFNSYSEDRNPIFDYPQRAENYKVQLISETEHNCKDTVYMDIIIQEEFTFYAPTAISLNSPIEKNRFFKPAGDGISNKDYNMVIFNRYGEKIFETNSKEVFWDGKINGGKYVEIGVYPWIINYTDNKGSKQRKTGEITVLK